MKTASKGRFFYGSIFGINNNMKLNIPNPCDANWELMQIKMHSRHCSLCQKDVMDFTKMSRAEIMVYLLNQPKGSVCGRMRPDQFDLYEEDLPELLQVISRPAYAKNAMMILALVCASLSSCESTTTPKQKSKGFEQAQSIRKVVKKENPQTDTKKGGKITAIIHETEGSFLQGDVIPIPSPPVEGMVVIEPEIPQIDTSEESNLIVATLDKEAEFPGGIKELLKFINTNLMYPQDALFNSIEGRVYLEFIVEKDGSLSNVKVNKGVAGYSSLEKEAVRVLEAMPKWKPAEFNDNFVRSKMRIPVFFRLN
ncbi:MAG: hypothetical protein RL264_409 [Bacteroidota bacterium]|jgi:TonB family protein